MEQHREVSALTSLLGMEVMPKEITWRKELFELFKTTLMTSLIFEEAYTKTSSVHMWPVNKYVSVFVPVTLAAFLTTIKSITFAARRWIKEHEIFTGGDLERITKRLNSIFEWVNWFDDLFGNFLLAYLFAIWLLGVFYPGEHPNAPVELLVLYYACVLGGSILFSVFQAILEFNLIEQFFNRLAQELLPSLLRKVGYLVGYDLKFLLGNFATLGAIDQIVRLIYFFKNKEKNYRNFSREYAFPLFYARTGVAGVLAFYPSCRLIYELFKDINHKTSGSYLAKLEKMAMFAFSVAIIDAIARAIHDNDVLMYGAYLGMLFIVPILIILNQAPCFQQLSYEMIKPSSIPNSRYIIQTAYQATGDARSSIRSSSHSTTSSSSSITDYDIEILFNENIESPQQIRHRPPSAQHIAASMSRVFSQTDLVTRSNNNNFAPET